MFRRQEFVEVDGGGGEAFAADIEAGEEAAPENRKEVRRSGFQLLAERFPLWGRIGEEVDGGSVPAFFFLLRAGGVGEESKGVEDRFGEVG